jgi:hypothetical protein
MDMELRASARGIIRSWTGAGLKAGLWIGGIYGSCLYPILGTVIGMIIGFLAGLFVGSLIGLLFAAIRPALRYAPLAAAAATELILLPLQVWLLLVMPPTGFLFLVIPPSVVSVGVAAVLGRRLPPRGRAGACRVTWKED